MADPKSMRLLVVEGNPSTQRILAKMLQDAGYTSVSFAHDANGALQALSSTGVDMLLLEWKVAEPRDFFLVRKIRSTAKLANLPLMIMMGGAVTQAKVADAVKAGARSFILRPFNETQFEQKVSETLRSQALAKAKAAPKKSPGGPAASGQPTKGAAPGPGGAGSPGQPSKSQAVAAKLFLRGYEKLQLRKYLPAVEDFKLALKYNPDFPEAYKAIAQAMKGKGDSNTARQLLNKAAEIYARTDRNDEALTLYTDILKADPDANNPFKIAGIQLREEGKLDKSIEVLENARKFHPKDAEITIQLSHSLRETGDEEAALERLKELLGLDPECPAAADLFLSIAGENFYDVQARELAQIQFLEEQEAERNKPVEKRRTPRIPLADYSVILPRAEEPLPVVNINESGLSFKFMSAEFQVGETITFDLIELGVPRAKRITATIVYLTTLVAGCSFQSITPGLTLFLDRTLPYRQKQAPAQQGEEAPTDEA
jgi:tetratricopeptide (TPR) repeat protein